MPDAGLLVSGLCALAVIGLLGWDRHRWRALYFELDRQSRERERHLFDQLLLKNQGRVVGSQLQPVKAESSPYPTIGEEDMDILNDRINEYVEAGKLGYGEAAQLARDAQYGAKTKAQIDNILFERQRELYTGSVADVIE